MNMIMIATLVIIANILFCYFPSSVLFLCKISISSSSSIIVIIICYITTINSQMGQGSYKGALLRQESLLKGLAHCTSLVYTYKRTMLLLQTLRWMNGHVRGYVHTANIATIKTCIVCYRSLHYGRIG